MNAPLVLVGTSDELKSPRALKVLATAVSASLPLTRTEVLSEDDVRAQTNAKSIALTYGSGSTHVASTGAMMRLIASLAPGSNLLGATDVDKALVDGWMNYAATALDLPLEALARAPSSQGKADVQSALRTLDAHLQYHTFMVGDTVTLADICLVTALYTASTQQLWDADAAAGKEENLVRWYQTIVHQAFFQTALNELGSVSKAVGAAPAASGTGLLMNGPAPPVVNKMYNRHRIRIKEVLTVESYMNQSITVAGWARTTRNANKGQLLFVELNDGSTGSSLQCVLDVNTTQGFEECKASGGTGASFQFVGTVVPSLGEGQAVEMQVTSGKLLGAVYGGNPEGTAVGGMLYPIPKKNNTLEYMREQAHMRPRTRIHAAAMRIRHAMAYATHNFFHNHGFLYIHTPIVTCTDCEGAGEQFAVTTMLGSDHLKPDVKIPVHEPPPPEDPEKKLSKKEQKRRAKKEAAGKKSGSKPEDIKVPNAIDYSKDFFARRANLTVSGQLNVETHACALSDVYTFGPTFRAENSHTARHLSEFWMIEPEIAFADLNDDLNLAEDYLKYCVQYALENCAEDLEFFETNPNGEEGLRSRLRNVLDNPFKRLTYTEAIEILQKAVAEDGVEFEEKPEWGIDLPSEHERYLCEKVFKMPVVLTDYPKDIKAFYMKLNDDGKTVAAADILVPKIGEIIGGSQREDRVDVLMQRCSESRLDPKAIWWYLDLRKYGTVPHAGFGLGFERLILFITGLQNIRDVIPFPRWAGNADF